MDSDSSKPDIKRVNLSGSTNETVTFQFAIRCESKAIAEPKLCITPFSSVQSRLEASAVEIFQIHPVTMDRWPGWHIRSIPAEERIAAPLDVLVPLSAPKGGLPPELKPGEVYFFWVDVPIPKETPDGIYTADLELRSGKRLVESIIIELTVWPLHLADEPAIPIIAEISHSVLALHHPGKVDGNQSELLHRTVQLLQSHRLAPVVPTLSPEVRISPAGMPVIEWARFDALVEPWLNGRAFENGVPLSHWPLPIEVVLSDLLRSSASPSSSMTEIFQEFAAECARHFKEKGWGQRAYMVLNDQFPISPSDFQRIDLLSYAAKSSPTPIRVASALVPQEMGPFGWTGFQPSSAQNDVDIWMPRGQFFDPLAMSNQRAIGRESWMAVDRPPFTGSISVHAPSTHTRVLAWQAYACGAQALRLGEVNHWPPGKSSEPNACIRFDPSVLLYPGEPYGLSEPVASVRLKHLRRSLEDAAYVRLLKDGGLEHIAQTLQRSLTWRTGTEAYRTHYQDGRPIGWADDPELFEAARSIMAEELINANAPGKEFMGSESFARSAAWRRFMLDSRRVRMHVDGTRIRILGSAAKPSFEIQCHLTIENGSRVPVSGTLSFGESTTSTVSRDSGVPVGPIPPNETRKYALTATTPSLQAGAQGRIELPIEFTTNDNATSLQTTAALHFMTTAATTTRLRADGDLSDWAPGTTNTASDFQDIASRSPETEAVGDRPPTQPCWVLTAYDEHALYVAVNCEMHQDAGADPSRSNAVRYDDGIPNDEDDWVELLIDPLNAGTRSPADLFHIVVKRSGAVLTEKGIRFEPPVGYREPWSADLDIGSQLKNDRWISEMRIPFAAFGPVPRRPSVWGFNITHFNGRRQRFTTWSGADGNAYDPLSLGNLLLP